jgi:hypothetical protein
MSLSRQWGDDFKGPTLDARWVSGHLNHSAEASLDLAGGLRLAFREGRDYATAGVVLREPLLGDFAASLRFSVSNPQPGTTFEIAAVQVAPPAAGGAPPEGQERGYRVFNVHGSPPYASSEVDEDDGWRIGWNWGSRQGRLNHAGDWQADNTDNRYGKSQNGPVTAPTSGWLRLSRIGQHWASHGRRDEGEAWQQTGQLVLGPLSGPVYLRLMAKHWVKTREELTIAPANVVVLTDFELWA